MYEEFKSLIYKSKEEEQAVIDEVILDVMEKNSCTKEELLKVVILKLLNAIELAINRPFSQF